MKLLAAKQGAPLLVTSTNTRRQVGQEVDESLISDSCYKNYFSEHGEKNLFSKINQLFFRNNTMR